MGPSRGDTICGNVVIEALGPMHFGALALGPIHMARTPTEPRLWLVTVERTLLPRSVDVSRFMAGVGELATRHVTGSVPLVLVDREADFCVVGFRTIDGARTLAAVAEAGEDEDEAARLAVALARTLADLHRHGALHGALTPTTVVLADGAWLTWEYGIVGLLTAERYAPRLRPLGGDAVAPELRAGGPVSTASDVFAWGAAVACLLTGASGSDAIALLQDSDATGPLHDLVRACLEPIPELRPRDGVGLLARVEAVVGTGEATAETSFAGLAGEAAPRVAAPAAGRVSPQPSPSDSAEFSFAELNEPSPAAPTHEIVELLNLGADDESGPVRVAEPPVAAEPWRELAEKYLSEAEVPIERPAVPPELEPMAPGERRPVEALGRVALVRTRVRTGPQRATADEQAPVSGAFDMPDEPEPEPSVLPRAAEGARDLPLPVPGAEDDWDDPDAAVFDLDAPGAPRVDDAEIDPDPDPEGTLQWPGGEAYVEATAPWNEPTPVDGLGTRVRRMGGDLARAPEGPPPASPAEVAPTLTLLTPTSPFAPPLPGAVPSPAAEPSLRAEPAARLELAPPDERAPSLEPSPPEPIKPAPSGLELDRTAGPRRPSPAVVSVDPQPVGSARARADADDTPPPAVDRVPSRPQPTVDRVPSRPQPPADRTPSRPQPLRDVSASSGSQLARDSGASRPIPAQVLGPGPIAHRSGALAAWSIALAAGLLAVAGTLAAAKQRGGLSQLLGGGAAPEAPETPVGEGDAPEPTPAPAPQPATPASTCPDGMRPIEGMRVCIDQAESPGLGEIPQTSVDLAAARAGCAERHARLCTPAQWRAACRGPKSWRHPYGARAEIDRCNGAAPSGAVQDLSRAGARDRCVTPSGVFDLEGNVAEWVDDGSVLGGDSTTRSPSCDSRSRPADGAGSPSIGYRCCLDLAADHR